ncbi:hypothetical protein GGX14DRAFT_619841 [Mycena pura]|uniref:Uncharacterized protein n=1 Tax=Mycena pura TaxID=153505 RepID=A0AAD6VPQ5_9AGAR|nr:hypothetical protein GGX14DRAFT_619841 [Mycena pura]
MASIDMARFDRSYSGWYCSCWRAHPDTGRSAVTGARRPFPESLTFALHCTPLSVGKDLPAIVIRLDDWQWHWQVPDLAGKRQQQGQGLVETRARLVGDGCRLSDRDQIPMHSAIASVRSRTGSQQFTTKVPDAGPDGSCTESIECMQELITNSMDASMFDYERSTSVSVATLPTLRRKLVIGCQRREFNSQSSTVITVSENKSLGRRRTDPAAVASLPVLGLRQRNPNLQRPAPGHSREAPQEGTDAT